MKIGITGSRYGITKQQLQIVKDKLHDSAVTEVHHGSCHGADEAIHNELVSSKKIIIHPPLKTFYRFYPKPHENIAILPDKDYLQRNRDIVDACDVLFAFPKEYKVQHRGGTWSTVKYAESAGKMVYCVYPDGRVAASNLLAPLHKQNLNDV